MGAKGSNVFDRKTIRAEFDPSRDEWMFSAVDIVSALTDSPHGLARKRWGMMKYRLRSEEDELATNCGRLRMAASDGKRYATDVLNKAGAAGTCGTP